MNATGLAGWYTRRAMSMVRTLHGRLNKGHRLSTLRAQIRTTQPLKVILGAGPVTAMGWIGTDADMLDVTSPRAWKRLFLPNSVDCLMAEHLFEHLSDSQCMTALTQCFRYLKRGGLLRIAVPDGYRKDPEYVQEVTPPKDGHQLLFTVDDLTERLERIGFLPTPLEYFDAQDQFHHSPWEEADGLIRRSVRYDRQEPFKRGSLYYTSLIIDARKP
jgi:predicted SAM-dependent methyltransferase